MPPELSACPACGAALRPGSPWCTLCYTDLRPPEQRPVQPAAPAEEPPAPAPQARVGDPLTQPLIDFLPTAAIPAPAPVPVAEQPAVVPPVPGVEPTWPCTSCGAPNPLSSNACATCGAAFLSDVAQEGRPGLVLPLVGDLTRISRGQRLLVALGFVVLLSLVVAVLTLLLTHSPAQPPTESPTGEPTVTVITP